MVTSGMEGRRGTLVAGTALATAVVLACLVLTRERPVSLMFEGAPQDPIVSPLLSGYDASEAAARELGRVVEPLAGAFPQARRMQMYRGLGGIQRVPRSAVQAVYELEPLGPAGQAGAEERPVRGRVAMRPPKGSPHAKGGQAATSTIDTIQKMYSGLHDPEARAAGATLVNEGEAADALAKTVSGELPLKSLEGHMKKAINIAQEKIRVESEKEAGAEDELARYRKEVAASEQVGQKNLEYLRATRNYATFARKEVLNAERLDAEGQRVLAAAGTVLSRAHDAEVKARVTGDQAGLNKAQALVARELRAVEHAKAGHAEADKERADAKEETFVSQVIARVRAARFAKHPTHYARLERMGEDAHSRLAAAQRALRAAEATKRTAQKWLQRATYQDAVRATVSHTETDAERTLQYLRAEEAAGAKAAREGGKWSAAVRRAAQEALAARRAELAAAQSAVAH